MKKTLLSLLICGAMIAFTGCKDDKETPPDSTIPVTPPTTFKSVEEDGITYTTIKDYGLGIGTRTLTNDKVWDLNGIVFVNSGQTLTIEEGTIIRGLAGQGERSSALVVAKGGMIEAIGTASDPIIFTTEFDAVEDNGGKLELAGAKTVAEQGLWGGVIILGKAKISRAAGTQAIEGISATDPRGIYGGNKDDDDSGTLKYVSILHGGTNIGSGNEINGLTMGGVGNGTTIDYVEVVANRDDGIECFGGSVDIKHAVVAFNGDDCFDFDEGYTGRLQFIVAIQSDAIINSEVTDHGNEHDGGPSDCRLCDPKAYAIISNATFLGVGAASESRAVRLIEYAGGEYHNMLVWGFKTGFQLEDLAGTTNDVKGRFDDGEVKIMNVSYEAILDANFVRDQDNVAITGTNVSTAAETLGISNNQTVGGVDVKPATTGISASVNLTDSFFENTTYRGAIDPAASGSGWLSGWTYLDAEGYLAD